MENLAWAACQIHCYCNSTISISEAATVPNGQSQPESLPSLNDTSISAAMKGQGLVVLKTEPKILFCDLRLAPGETKSCEYKNISSNSYFYEEMFPFSRSLQRTSSTLQSSVVQGHLHQILLQNHHFRCPTQLKRAGVASSDSCPSHADNNQTRRGPCTVQ